MEIIAAARRTGKSTYSKLLAKDKGILVVVPTENYGKLLGFDLYITYNDLLKGLRRSKSSYSKYSFIFEEPGLCDMEFLEIFSIVGYSRVELVIGTPMSIGPGNSFNLFLEWYRDKVKIWKYNDPEWRAPLNELIGAWRD